MRLTVDDLETILMWNGTTVAEFGANTPAEDALCDRLREELKWREKEVAGA